jgi:hypothetical protein
VTFLSRVPSPPIGEAFAGRTFDRALGGFHILDAANHTAAAILDGEIRHPTPESAFAMPEIRAASW